MDTIHQHEHEHHTTFSPLQQEEHQHHHHHPQQSEEDGVTLDQATNYHPVYDQQPTVYDNDGSLSLPDQHDDGAGGSSSTSVLLTRPTLLPPRPLEAPCPEQLAFSNKHEFKQWLNVESQWCHFVQRRTTTPEKRAIERMRAREKAHEQLLASLPPDEAAAVAPLKKRKRQRTSPVFEKITYACHHSGSYTSRHSTTLPASKLRMNTKKSVKCDCQAKIIASEMENGEVRVAYHWRHTGHAPGSMEDLQRSRLPPDVDAWLVRQIEAGKDTEEIRKLLEMSPADKEEYLRTVAQLPAGDHDGDNGEAALNAAAAADLPPTIALNLRIKYPDIYNRYRKLRGPIKATKTKKTPQPRKRRGVSREEPAEEPTDYSAPEVVGIGFPLELRGDQEHALDADGLQGYDPTSHVELAMALSARRNEQMIDPLLMDAVDAVMGETAMGLESAEGAQNAWEAMRLAGMDQGQDGQQDGGNPF